jgi:hypothetical protein
MHGSASPVLAPQLPAYAAELAKGRRRGLRPPTWAECSGAGNLPGLDGEVVVRVTDSWALAKAWRAKGLAAVVIEPGPMYDFKWARGWIVAMVTSEPFSGLAGWVREQGASVVTHLADPARIKELEERARA